MCGISGYVGGRRDAHTVVRMMEALRHRGPDGEGVYLDAEDPVALAHNRLSIIDLSDNGTQPMADASGRFVVAFNGEIYNYKEIRADLPDYPYRSTCDTEVVLAAYAKWGESCVERFVGMFAVAIWDRVRRTLFCARDRFGVKPFYVAEHGGRFLFASEIKALLAAGVPRDADDGTWADYLAHGIYDHDERTFFRHVKNLAPGTTLTVGLDGARQTHRYWNLAANVRDESALPFEEALERFDALFRDSLALRLRSDVPVGINLSGGLDSSAMMSALGDLAPGGQGVHAFTASFDDPRYDEVVHARRISSQVACIEHVSRLAAVEVPDLAEKLMYHTEAPFGGIATLSYFKLHRDICAQGIKVVLEGQGADETMAGYNVFLGAHYRDLLAAGRCGDLRRSVRASPFGKAGLELARALGLGDAGPVYQDGSSHIERSFLSEETVRRAGAYPRFAEPFASHLDNALYRELSRTKLPRVLRMNDNLAMAFGVELRQPFLDHRLVAYLFGLPGDFKIKDGRGKYLLREWLSRRAPADFAWEAKRAVVTPQREWMVGPLRDWVFDMLGSGDFAATGYFDVSRAKSIFENYLSRGVENAFPIWQWINCCLWHRHARSTGTAE